MNIENRAIKVYIRELPPNMARHLIEKYRIPSPYKEILIAICVERKRQFAAIDYLKTEYGIHIGFRTLSRYLSDALIMFRKARAVDPKDYLR